MLLVIDIGNTNISFAIFEKNKILYKWRLSTKGSKTADEYYLNICDFLELAKIKINQIDSAIISNVVPQSLFEIKAFFEKYLKITPLVVGEKSVKLPIQVKITNPNEVGADRIVNAVGALKISPTPIIIIDFGTATTFDVVDKNKNYIGGVIAPGVNLSLSSLHKTAAKLPQIEIAKPEKVIGKSTIEAMQSGIFYGYKGLIEELIKQITKELGGEKKPFVIATGGLGILFADASNLIDTYNEDLTIHGLKTIWEFNENN